MFTSRDHVDKVEPHQFKSSLGSRTNEPKQLN